MIEGFFKFLFGKLIFIVLFGFVTFVFVFNQQIRDEYKSHQKLNSKKVIQPAIESATNITNNLNKATTKTVFYSPTLDKAREYYWQKKYQQSIDEYQKLIKTDANNIDFHGELANVLYGTGELKLAQKELFITAKLLLKNKEIYRAKKIHDVLITLDSELATQLSQLIINTKPQD